MESGDIFVAAPSVSVRLQTCSELRQLMRDNVMGLLYPLNRFWEYTLESPKNEFYIVNLLAG